MTQWKPLSSSFECVTSSYLLHTWCQGDAKTILSHPTIQTKWKYGVSSSKEAKTFLIGKRKGFKQVQHHNMSKFVIPKKKKKPEQNVLMLMKYVFILKERLALQNLVHIPLQLIPTKTLKQDNEVLIKSREISYRT